MVPKVFEPLKFDCILASVGLGVIIHHGIHLTTQDYIIETHLLVQGYLSTCLTV